MSSKYTENVICLYCNKEVYRIMSSKYTENVICLYCNKEVSRTMSSKYTENVICLYCNKEVYRIMSSKYTENVICLYCNKEVSRKKSPNDTKHDGQRLNYKSAVSRNISSMLCLPVTQSSKKFNSSSTNLSSEHNIQFEDEELENSLDPPSKVSRVSAEVGSGNDPSLVELSDKVSELSSQVKNLISAVSQSKKREIIRNNNNLSDSLGDDHKHLLIKHARGLNSMIKWLDDWLLVGGGLKCIACIKVISYGYDAEGREFDDEDKLSQEHGS